MWKVSSLPQEVGRHPYHQRLEIQGGEGYVNCLNSSLNSTQDRFFVLSILLKCIVLCLNAACFVHFLGLIYETSIHVKVNLIFSCFFSPILMISPAERTKWARLEIFPLPRYIHFVSLASQTIPYHFFS